MGKDKKIKIGQKKNESTKKVLEEIENKAIECLYVNMYDWQRRDLSKEDLFEYAEDLISLMSIRKRWSLVLAERIK